ncbi:MAG TPA: amidohydrolase family protein [Vicinamibacterales bacterium]|jgi:imidazolonepropionase-like amidohydrolase|nr:amidohydrolase family protein [Vicinamibacterales bacterium]HJN46072.1 amidohydrolase family protein [Vicinamibacterales bacterium]|tara:strand:+ start:2414 stop:3769 length:1356 start_codon:yes stop_codon:yes gene_type:complete
MNMRSIAVVTGLAVGITACGGGAPEETTSTVVAYEGATLITGDGGPPLGGGVLVVDQGVITGVGLATNVTIPEGATVVDLTGKTVMPTLVDLHGHVGFVDDLSFDNANYTRENITDQLDRYAYHGVGTIVSLGTDSGDLAFEIQVDQQAGTLGGARLHTAFRGIARPDAGPGAPTMRPTAFGASTEEEARALVAEIAETNADFLKIWVDDRGGSVEKLGRDLYGPIIEAAHEHDLQVIAHIFFAEDARQLVDAGVDGFAHLARDVEMDDELVAAIVEHDVFVMPNLAVSERGRNAEPPAWVDDPLLAESVSPEGIARIRASYENRTPEAAAQGAASFATMLRSLKKLSDAGARLVLGADTGIQDHIQGYMEHHELELIVEAGISPAEAIKIATSAPAEVLGVDTGLLAAGKRADFIVLDANPMYGIGNTRQISAVYLDGTELDREALRAAW